MKLLIMKVMDCFTSKKNYAEYAMYKKPQFGSQKMGTPLEKASRFLFGCDHVRRVKEIINYIPNLNIWLINDSIFYNDELLTILGDKGFPTKSVIKIFNDIEEAQNVSGPFDFLNIIHLGYKPYLPSFPFLHIKEGAGLTDTEKYHIITFFKKIPHFEEIIRKKVISSSEYDKFHTLPMNKSMIRNKQVWSSSYEK